MGDFLKLLLPQELINIFYHLPKAILANILYGFPSRNLTVIGVTGTDGKTTTVNMIYQILKSAGKKVSMVSTINSPGLHVTSPDPFIVQRLVKKAIDQGNEYLVLEVTSHALDQYRFWGINFEVGVITNITHEHLDYHKTFEKYFQAKAKLIKNVRIAILNHGEKQFQKLVSVTHRMCNTVTFGLIKSADFNPIKFPIKLKIPGEFNKLNALAAAAVAVNLDISDDAIKKSLSNFSALPGRMEEIGNDLGIKIVIDFAHTPNALEQALKALKNKGKLIAVFGSAGKRDVQKRFLMGQVAGKLADILIITAEDPRGELEKINKEITTGAIETGAKLNDNLFIIDDRREAITFAIKSAKAGDTVGIFGKGHEKSINLDGNTELPWSDQKTVKKVLNG